MKPGKTPYRNNALNYVPPGSFGLLLACSPIFLLCCCCSCACVPLSTNLPSLLPVTLNLLPPRLVLVVLLPIIPGSPILLVVLSSLHQSDAHPVKKAKQEGLNF